MHENCSCPNCVGIPRAEYYIISPYYNGEAWRQGKPEERKSRRLVLIRDAWQHVVDFEDWIYPIHTISYGQTDVQYGFHRLRRWGDQPPETTQECLSLMD